MEIKLKQCQADGCENEFKQFNSLQKYCSPGCKIKSEKPKPIKQRKPINKVSKKRKVENLQYSSDRLIFLQKPENQICFIDGCNKPSTTIEHRKGRKGYADKWAKDNNIPLLLDQRFWAGCCHFHNLELERDPELSKKYQLSKIHDGKKIEKTDQSSSFRNGN